jgi:predicted nucleotidyltransferase
MRIRNLLFVVLIGGFLGLRAQPFTEQTGIYLNSAAFGTVAWGDYDNDGDLDILLTGSAGSSIYKNNGNNTFSQQTGIMLGGLSGSKAAWGDYDNDGDLDILFATGTCYLKIFKNNGNNTFTEQTASTLTGVCAQSITWGDYDNDGDLDYLFTGFVNTYRATKIYKNNGNNTFSEQTGISLQGVNSGSAAWGDYDNDGDLDILLTGYTGSSFISKIYTNNGNNIFTELPGISLIGVWKSSIAWGDYNNDGNLDILLTGESNSSGYVSKIYKNNGNNTFTEQTGISMQGVTSGSVAWGDCDNDGDLDILMTGWITNIAKSTVYQNNGNNTFTELIGTSFTAVNNSSVAWGDYDNDGDLDIILAGSATSNPVTRIYKNNTIIANSPPSPPLGFAFDAISCTFSWNKAIDDHTSSNGLSYNIAIGSLSNPDTFQASHSHQYSGWRRLPALGNCQSDTFCRALYSFPFNIDIYARVQAIDNSFLGSAFSDSIIFHAPPTGQFNDDTIHIVCGDSAQLLFSITNGSPDSLTYSWNPTTNLSNFTSYSPIAFPSQSTWYYVVASSKFGAFLVDSIFVDVDPLYVDAGPDTSICEGDSIQLEITATGCPGNYTYYWSPAYGLNNQGIANPLANPVTNTTYSVTVSDNNGNTEYDDILITVYPLPIVSMPAYIPLSFYAPPLVLQYGTPSGGVYSGPGVYAGEFIASMAGYGPHSIKYTYTDPITGCSNSATAIIDVVTGIYEQRDLISLYVFPNPGNGLLTLSIYSKESDLTIDVVDVTGRIVRNEYLWNTMGYTQHKIDLSQLPHGIYNLRINSSENRTAVKVIII